MFSRPRPRLGPMALMIVLLAACGGDPQWESTTHGLNAPSQLELDTEAPRLTPALPTPGPHALSSPAALQLRQTAWDVNDGPATMGGQTGEDVGDDPVPINGGTANETDDDPVPINGQTAQDADDDPVPINGQTAQDADDDPVPINGQTAQEADDDPVPIKGRVDLERMQEDSGSPELVLAPDLADRIANRR